MVTGIAGMESMKAVGKTGAIALIYFEVVSTLALIIGLCVVNVLQPGAGMNVDPSSLDASAISVYADQAQSQGIIPFLLDVIPASVIGAFAGGNILQVLLFAVLFGFSCIISGRRENPSSISSMVSPRLFSASST